MRHLFLTLASSACICLALAGTAQAGGHGRSYIEEKIAARPELSRFAEALQKTGISKELNQGESYSVFAPANSAFDALEDSAQSNLDMCFLSENCKAELAKVLRNHIVPQEVSYADPGLHAVHSIDGFTITLHEPRKGDRYANGKKVLEQQGLFGGQLYVIDGLMQDTQERVDLRAAVKHAAVEVENIRLEQESALIGLDRSHPADTTQVVTPDTVVTEKVYYGRNGLVDARVTTVKPPRQ